MIAIITDFGRDSFYTGQMRGVIKSLSPSSEVVDITNSIPPFDITAGQFVLFTSFRYFPQGTVFLVVVDPGVGSSRKAIALYSDGYYFVGPDNGIFGFLRDFDAVELPIPEGVSRTFHGRDVFAPAAARLDMGIPLYRLGKGTKDIVRFDFRDLEFVEDRMICGRVVMVDDFGNLITGIDSSFFMGGSLRIGDSTVERFAGTFSDVERGEIFFYVDSFGFLEVAVREGSAGRTLGIGREADVCIIPDRSTLSRRAFYFAAFRHGNQKRKFSYDFYVIHLRRVADILREFTEDEEIISAAYLHDVVEDTPVRLEDVEGEFGRRIASLVHHLTDDKAYRKQVGRLNYVLNKVKNMPPDALLIKLADRLDNVLDLKKAPEKFRRKYFEETRRMIEAIESREDLTPAHRILLERLKCSISTNS